MKLRAEANSPALPATSMPNHSPSPVLTSQGLRPRYPAVTAVLRRLLAHIICGPVYPRYVAKMWSCVVLVRPSNSKFTPSRSRPHDRFASGLAADLLLFFLPPPEWRVKTATPRVTVPTTKYL
jgi:hypothetical protein